MTRHITVSTAHIFTACTHHSTLQHLPFRCLVSLFFRAHMGKHQNMRLPHGTTWLESLLLHRYFLALNTTLSPTFTSWCKLLHTGVQRHSALQASCPAHLPHSAISSQVLVGPTRNVTGIVMSATLAEAATQLPFAEFFERCNLLVAPPPRPQPSPALLRDCSYVGLFHTALLLPMRPPWYRSQSSFSGLNLLQRPYGSLGPHHRHMEMPAAPHFPNPLTSPLSTVPAAPAAPAVVRLHAPRLLSAPPPPPASCISPSTHHQPTRPRQHHAQ